MAILATKKKAVVASSPVSTLEAELSAFIVEAPKSTSVYRVDDSTMKSNLKDFLKFAELKVIAGSIREKNNEISARVLDVEGNTAFVNSGRYGIVRYAKISYKPDGNGGFELFKKPSDSADPVEDTPF